MPDRDSVENSDDSSGIYWPLGFIVNQEASRCPIEPDFYIIVAA